MDLRKIQFVIAVADEGSMTAAAQASHVAQPSLSEAIRSLEAEIGAELFHRIGRGVVLTSAGEAFVAAGRQVIRDVETVRSAVAAVAGVLTGRLDLVALPTLAVDPVARLIGAFRRAHPGITVRLREPDIVEDVNQAIATGMSEVGITQLPASDTTLVSEALFTQELKVVSPPGTPRPRGRLKVAQLAGLALIATPAGTSTRQVLEDALAAVNVTPNVVVETAQREAVLPLVLAGAGSAVVAEGLAAAARRDGAQVRGLDPPLVRRVGVLHRAARLSPAATAFLNIARAKPGSRR